jgi:2-dehydropantoate 2-reductase
MSVCDPARRREWHASVVQFIVVGAGAIGSVVGARLFESGHRVQLIARGPQLEALRKGGLTLETPDATTRLDIPVVDDPARLDSADDAVVLLCVKSNDTAGALDRLAAVAPAETPVVCVQNGVANERMAQRRFGNVYGVPVMCPATFLIPGVVQAHSTPTTGILDIGRHPTGRDQICHRIADAFARSSFVSQVRDDIMRWKHRKLITNLTNAVEAICGREARRGRIAQQAITEGELVLATAGIDVASADEDRLRRGDHLNLQPIDGRSRDGGSAWQSLARRTGTVEADYLNGEIVVLGRLHGVSTPVNHVLQWTTRRMAIEGRKPGTFSEDDLLSLIRSSVV